MSSTSGTLRTCDNGHQYYKSSDCPTCPTCEQARKPNAGFLARLSAPARRALEHQGIATLQQLSAYSEKEILSLHGMGPKSMPTLRAALAESGLAFKSH
ncbi:RNA polymerase alpha subunit C-terminal domain-containing protein [Paenibacillus xanthanilyticus]|uniref:RNA polymerase alpha subunit C-terminal domain-containing protein n=1 Tax=Paenibacillus xanthanilyticus TaxID=1783531 RepID=A0ABV8K123_9BACL